VTALIIWLGLIPETFLSTLISVSAFTLVFALALWKKLSALQNKTDNKRAESDLIGHSFVLPADIAVALPLAEKPSYQYSGINWQLNAQEDLSKGTMVEVIQADVGALLVKAK
jgi:membrane protein implicated in regulation of membrane protease activity